MSRTVAHVYRKPDVPISSKYETRSLPENLRHIRWYADLEDLSRASTRHVLRYRRNAGDRTRKEQPKYIRKRISRHDYDRVAYDRGQNAVVTLMRKHHSSNRTNDRMASREAVRWFASREQRDDLTECFISHWHRHAALMD